MDLQTFSDVSTRLQPLRRMLADLDTAVQQVREAAQYTQVQREETAKLQQQAASLQSEVTALQAEVQRHGKLLARLRAEVQAQEDVLTEAQRAAATVKEAAAQEVREHREMLDQELHDAEAAHQARLDILAREQAEAEAQRDKVRQSLAEVARHLHDGLTVRD